MPDALLRLGLQQTAVVAIGARAPDLPEAAQMPDQRLQGAMTASPGRMKQPRPFHLNQRQSRQPQPGAEVEVFAIHAKSLVETAHFAPGGG